MRSTAVSMAMLFGVRVGLNEPILPIKIAVGLWGVWTFIYGERNRVKTWKFAAYVLLCIACGSAVAQRRVLPIIDLVDVPVAMANAKVLTADQVRGAIIAAALAAEWDVAPMSNGELHLSVYKDMEYRITMAASYTPATYKLVYISSENLNTADADIRMPTRPGGETLAAYATKW